MCHEGAGFFENLLSKIRAHPRRGNDIHGAPKCLRERTLQSRHIRQRTAGFHCDENIDVARRARIAARNRAKESHILRAMLLSEFQKLGAIGVDDARDPCGRAGL